MEWEGTSGTWGDGSPTLHSSTQRKEERSLRAETQLSSESHPVVPIALTCSLIHTAHHCLLVPPRWQVQQKVTTENPVDVVPTRGFSQDTEQVERLVLDMEGQADRVQPKVRRQTANKKRRVILDVLQDRNLLLLGIDCYVF